MSIRNVYDSIASFETIMTAEKHTSLHKRYDAEVLRFRDNYEENIYDIVNALRSGEVPPTSYKHFYVYIPKVRKVIYIDYKSKIIQRAIYDVVNPLVCKGFIDDSFSCIVGKGQLNAMLRLQGWMRYAQRSGEQWYYLKLDVEKFFYRMDHKVMMDIIRKKIGDKRVQQLLEHYICEAAIPFGLPLGMSATQVSFSDMLWDVGIPIGGGLSHMLANMYLDVLDQECKRTLGIKHYIRYMDDIIILHNDKEQLHYWKDYIDNYLENKLKLHLNHKTALRPIGQGIEFVGYRIWPNYVTLRKSTSLRMKRRLKYVMKQYRDYKMDFSKVTETVASYRAMLKHCDCKELNEKIWGDFVLTHNKEADYH